MAAAVKVCTLAVDREATATYSVGVPAGSLSVTSVGLASGFPR